MHKHLGGFEVFRGPMYQQGYGLGGYFRNFFKWIIPMAEKHALPHLKSGLEAVKNQAIQSVSNIAQDTIKGKNIRDSLQENVSQAIENLKSKAENKLRGGGKRKKIHKIVFKKKKNTNDIFD